MSTQPRRYLLIATSGGLNQQRTGVGNSSLFFLVFLFNDAKNAAPLSLSLSLSTIFKIHIVKCDEEVRGMEREH